MGNNVLAATLATVLALTPQPSAPADTISLNSWENLRPTLYVVQKGDSLSTIAQKVYGNDDFWTVLWKDNQWIENPTVLYSEWQLVLRKDSPQQIDTVLPENLSQKLATARAQEQITIAAFVATAQVKPREISVQTAQGEPRPSDYDAVYKAAGDQYGVPWQVLYGLHLTESGLRGTGEIYNKQGTGATGPMQFMPGTWRAYGVDGDGDGQANIHDVEDAIYGAANYLQKHGSLQQGLRSYGGNQSRTMQAAIQRGYDPNTN